MPRAQSGALWPHRAARAGRTHASAGAAWRGNFAAAVLRVSVMMRRSPCLSKWPGPVRQFAAAWRREELRMLRIRIEDKGPIAAFRRRGVPGGDTALARHEGVAAEAGRAGFLAGGVEGFARVVEGLLRAAR